LADNLPQLFNKLAGRSVSLGRLFLMLVDEAAHQTLELLSQRQFLVSASLCVLWQKEKAAYGFTSLFDPTKS
jgi:hypothetical protein